MSELRTIRDGEEVIAIVIPGDLPAEGVRFVTPQSYPFQVGVLCHKAGTVLKAHGHKKLRIETNIFQEILIIQSGRIVVDLYGMEHQFLESVELGPGDAILFVDGGHGVRMLTDAKIIEVKQGPYPGDKLAKVFIE
ncbi:MAG: hypothetical protein N2595_07640 [bacterium]|nr:hypothetical protein [bacterium]